MRRPAVTAAGFALADGAPVDPSGVVYVAQGADRAGRLLFACVEPLESSPRGAELALVALRTIRDTFAATPGAPADALLAGFASANAALFAQNRPLSTGRWQRNICVGATGVAIAGREIAVVQAPPSQAIAVQDHQLYAFPDVSSWRGDYAPEFGPAEAAPLGFADGMTPRLYLSEAAAGDLVLLCSTSVGRALAHDDEAVVALYGSDLLTRDLEGSIDQIERLLVRQEVADAFAIVVSLARLPGRSPLRRGLPARQTRSGRGPLAEELATAPTAPRLAPLASAGAWERPSGFRDWLIDTAELVARRKEREPTQIRRQLALAAPGALSVRRYRETPGLSPELRAHLPRGPGLQVPARLLALSLLVFVALGGTGVAMTRQKERERLATVALSSADAELRAAVENPGVAMTALTQAERSLAEARRAGGDTAELARREVDLARLRDDVWRIRRLGDVTRVGALPSGTDAGSARLALFDQTLYIAAGNLYQLDAEQRLLLALLSSGAAVTGGNVGQVESVSIDGGDLVAGDSAATYRRDTSGHWARSALPLGDVGGLRAGSPVVAWGNASYALSWDGDIVRFDQSSDVPRADVWAAVLDAPDLDKARDLAVDGRIHVLLDDDRILTFSRGVLSETVSAFITPALTGPAFLAEAPFASAHYIVDRNGTIGNVQGRIVRVGTSGDAWQYLVPEPLTDDAFSQATAVSLASASDLAIDELSGTVYWVANGEIWRARLPPS